MQADGLSASRIREAHIVISQVLQTAVRDCRIGRNARVALSCLLCDGGKQRFWSPKSLSFAIPWATPSVNTELLQFNDPRVHGATFFVAELSGAAPGSSVA
jgi:hypothetical protein